MRRRGRSTVRAMPLRIEDAVDLHCHFHPDSIGGWMEGQDDYAPVPALESAREALAQGHAALVLKPHGFANPAVAFNVELAVPGLRVFGGICTDHPTGGLNVYAVELALHLGAKIVWLPTVHSSVDFSVHTAGERHQHLGPVRVTDDGGALLPEVRDIADLVRQHGAVLATGHISLDEHFAVVNELGRSTKIVLTHAGEHRGGTPLSPAHAAELADLGAIVEITALECHSVLGFPGKDPVEMADYIAAVGPARCALSTDYGWNGASLPRPVAGFYEFLEQLWGLGVAEDDLVTMASRTPGRLLELPFAS
jgi:hypothetical protein